MSDKKGMSPWAWVGIGCGCLVLLAIAGTVTCGVIGARVARDIGEEISQMEEAMNDPVKRAERVAETLDYETLPDGYVPSFAMSFPFIGEIAILADRPLEKDGNDDFERMFFMYRIGSLVRLDSDWRDLVAGRQDLDDLLNQVDVRLRGREKLAEGTLTIDGAEMRYSSQRGSLKHGSGSADGVFAMLLAPCEDSPPVVAVWIEPDEHAGEPYEQIDWSGTPADPAAIESFVSHFNFCL